jgi:hypothetical protein
MYTSHHKYFGLSTLDTEGGSSYASSVAIGSDRLGLISYPRGYVSDVIHHDLWVAHCSNVACTETTKTAVDLDGRIEVQTSVKIGADGLGLISYYSVCPSHVCSAENGLKVAHCSNTSCTEAIINKPDQSGSVAGHTSITIGDDGMPLISYYDFADYVDGLGDLKVLHCGNYLCSD